MQLEYRQKARKQRITAAGVEARHRRAMRMFPELRQLFILKTTRAEMRQGDGVVDGVGKKGGKRGGIGIAEL